MQNYLDPRNDVVFKIFFEKKENKFLLIDFLETVIRPDFPIESIEFLSSEVKKETVLEKGAFLDLRLKLKNGIVVNVEMQMANKKFFKERVLHYWSKIHGQQLDRGEDYKLLKPTISIALLNYIEFPDDLEIGHTKFILKEDFYQKLSLKGLEIHFLELSKEKAWTKLDKVKYDSLIKWVLFSI